MHLTKTEIEVIQSLAQGNNSHDVADQRFRSQETIRQHIKNAREKLGAKNIAHLIYLALKKGLINSIFAVLILAECMPSVKQQVDQRKPRVARGFSVNAGRVRQDYF